MKYITSECTNATNVLNGSTAVPQTMTSCGYSTTQSSTSSSISAPMGGAGAGGHGQDLLSGGGGYSAAAGRGSTSALVGSQSSGSPSTTQLFCEQVGSVTSMFEKWNDCERTVVMYALLKKMPYSNLKFLQHSIENTFSQNVGASHTNLSAVVIDINANNPSYLQNLLNAYNTFHLGDLADSLSSSSSDKDSLTQCYSSDFQLTQCDERRLYGKKEDILHEILNMLPLLKPGNDDAKQVYLSLIPNAVKDTARRIVPAELVQQIFSYLLIHPAITSEDRRSFNVWLRHLEEQINTTNGINNNNNYNNTSTGSNNSSFGSVLTQPHKQTGLANCFLLPAYPVMGGLDHKPMTTSGSSASSSSSVSCSSASNLSIASSFGNLASLGVGSGSTGSIGGGGGGGGGTVLVNSSIIGSHTRNADWQTIAPPSKQHQQHQHIQQKQNKLLFDWSNMVGTNQSSTNSATSLVSGGSGSSIADQLCDNLNGITLNELASSQNSLGLSSIAVGEPVANDRSSSLVNGVVAAAATAVSTANSLFGGATNHIINIINNNTINNNNNSCSSNLNGDDHDTSFSKNGTEILDFEPNSCDSCSNSNNNTTNNNNNLHNNNTNVINNSMHTQVHHQHEHQQHMPYASILVTNYDQLDINRWSIDSKLAALKTRRSNSLTTQTISSSSSSSNSSVVTVNDNCSNSSENLSQFANKPRSFSLSIEHQRGGLTNSGSDTRLDDFKPNYVKFQTRNLGMSSIGWWLKSLRLHKYIELFKNMTYEEMLHITEEYLQSLGVTKGASHKLALCIEKLKERPMHLAKMEQDLMSGQMNVSTAIEELTHIVLTPMKPIEAVNHGEENVGLRFLKIVDLVCKLAPNDLYSSQDDESLSVIMWVLDRSLQSEAFVNHTNELKELKFKLSKLKMSITPKMHHAKNSSNSNLNKPSFPFSRWNSGKGRKCDPKNGSNDRINHRKNSNDLLSFPLSCLQQQQQQQQQNHSNQQHHHCGHPNQQQTDYDRYHHMNNSNNNNNNGNTNNNNSSINNNNSNNNNNNNSGAHHQYKSSSYPNFINNNNNSNLKHQQQQQIQQQLLQQHTHFPALPPQQQQQQPRSLNNLIVISGGPQQPQNMIYKPGQGMMPASGATTAELTHMENTLQTQQKQRKDSLTDKRAEATEVEQQQQLQPKKTMAAVVMVSNDDILVKSSTNFHAAAFKHQQQQNQLPLQIPPPPQILNNNNNNNNGNSTTNLFNQQQQQQLQLLAAVATTNNTNQISQLSCCTNSSDNNMTSNFPTRNAHDHNNHISSNCFNKTPNGGNNILSTQHNTVNGIGGSGVHITMNDIKSLEQLETLCLEMTEQAIN